MRRGLIAALLLCLLLSGARAEGVVLRTVSSFAGADTAAEAYVDILEAYEAETGNTVIDVSAASDEGWKTGVLNDFAAGNEPDVLFFFAAGADSAPILYKVVPIAEINAAYPALDLPENEALREPDGVIYAVPARSFWEGLYINADLFEAYGAPLPVDWASFTKAVEIFNAAGIVPVAVSLSDIPHYLAEFALLSCATAQEQQARPKTLDEVPASWFEAMALIREMYEMHAFAPNASATYESAATELFRAKKAAMQFDGSWLASSLPAESMATTLVLPMPKRDGSGAADNYIGGVSMGFYLTRRAWKSERKDAAVALLAALTKEESIRRLGYTGVGGQLLDSAEEMAQGRQMLSPLQDAMSPKAREVWLLECIPAVAAGQMTPEECWQRVMALKPFGE
ncbi:MAG: carbohydrate ABC transporter substrate-binding protein [Clostridia bacterium]|nr:carbohydrate ABC transporter substrate-binding protein [Clostridia bacterium]